MNLKKKWATCLGLGVGTLALALCMGGTASASLNVFQTYTGDVGWTQDGCGSLSATCTITLTTPATSTLINAYLYTSIIPGGGLSQTGSLDGNVVSYGTASLNPNGIASQRADVTSIVAPVVSGGGTFTFTVGEGNTSVQDGESLVLVYSAASLPTSTVAILDGFSASGGDTSSINFVNPLDPTQAGFTANMGISDGFSYDPPCSVPASGVCNAAQASTIKVDGVTMTTEAGSYDDGCAANGCLITVGGPNDPFTIGNDGVNQVSPSNPQTQNFQDDHEYYNLAPFITKGDTSIVLNTNNPSGDDNIFEEAFYVSGLAAVNAPPPTGAPEPGSLALTLTGLAMLMVAMLTKRRLARS